MAITEKTEKAKLRALIRNCMVFSLAWHIVTAIFSTGFHHFDEHFQVLEFAGNKLGLTPRSVMMWEFNDQMRAALLPTFVVGLMKVMGPNADPFICSFILRLFAGFLGWASLFFISTIALKWVQGYAAKRFLILASGLLWFFPYVQSHFHAESLTCSVFFFGIGYLWLAKERGSNYLFILAGLLLGLSFVIRYQTAFMIFGASIWCIFVARFSIRKLLFIALPAIFIIAVNVLIDRWFYGNWVCTAWNYFNENLVQGKVSGFGELPWWTYFEWLGRDLILPFSIFMMAGILYAFYKYPKNIVSLSCIPFLLMHIIIGHKEPRFLFPVINAVPILLAFAYQDIYRFVAGKKLWLVFMALFWASNVAFIIISSFKPAHANFGMYDFIYHTYRGKNAILVADGREPYDLDFLTVFFGRPEDIQVLEKLKMKTIDSIAASTCQPVIITYDNIHASGAFAKTHPHAKLVYCSVPPLIAKFNINDWMSRTRIWYVFELNPKNP